MRISLAFLALVLACGREAELPQSPPRQAPPPRPQVDEWWIPACGDVKPLQVGHGVTPPVLIERVDPKWPDFAGRTTMMGVIILEAVIDDRGSVCAVRTLRTFDGALGDRLANVAIDAVKQWKFTPALLNGKPRAAVYNLTIRFEPR